METNRILYDMLEALRLQMNDQHARTNERMFAMEQRIITKIDQHVRDDDLVADRVTIIETQRAEENKQAVKRGAWAGILAAAGLSGLLEIIKAWRS